MAFCLYYYANQLVEGQTVRNDRLKAEITKLDSQIKEIALIRNLRQALIARMNIVQNLQVTKTLEVRLLDEIIKIIPDGVYLNKMERVDNKITLYGYADSNSNVSTLMRKH